MDFRKIDYLKIDYLRRGNPRQRLAYEVLTGHGLLVKLAPYAPILAGTIPIAIDTVTSDLDIICYWEDPDRFKATLISCFSGHRDFTLWEKAVRGQRTIMARFEAGGFAVEVFGQNIPSHLQHAYRHMRVEDYLLRTKGEAFRQAVRELKQSGLKTEPAFAQVLGLEGDPYLALLSYEQEMRAQEGSRLPAGQEREQT